MSGRIDPHAATDIAYREAQRAYSRTPHPERRMLSMESRGPIKAWVCPTCRLIEHSVTTHPMDCFGGLAFV